MCGSLSGPCGSLKRLSALRPPLNVALMRFVSAALFCLIALAASAHAAGVEFVRVWPGWRDEESFVRISEYFTYRENTGRETVLRTQPDARAGFYFLTRTKTDAAISGATFKLEIVSPGNPQPRVYSFSADIPRGSRVFQIGVTGSDWPDEDTYPVAWRVTLSGSDGTVLTSAQSFLWSNPSN